MTAHPLHEKPLWRPEDFGKPMPDSAHPVSVAIPTVRQTIAVEREQLKSSYSYPRFGMLPQIGALTYRAKQHIRPEGEMLLLPSKKAAEACAQFAGGSVLGQTKGGVYAVTGMAAGLKAFWQHAGEIISTRRATDILTGRSPEEAQGAAAKMMLTERIAASMGAGSQDVYLYASGMAAIFNAHALISARAAGLPTVQFGSPYVDTLKVQQKFGSGEAEYIRYDSSADLERLGEFLDQQKAAAIYAEADGNPLRHTPDLKALRALLDRHDAPLIVDNTLSANNLDALPYSDIVVTSLTKF